MYPEYVLTTWWSLLQVQVLVQSCPSRGCRWRQQLFTYSEQACCTYVVHSVFGVSNNSGIWLHVHEYSYSANESSQWFTRQRKAACFAYVSINANSICPMLSTSRCPNLLLVLLYEQYNVLRYSTCRRFCDIIISCCSWKKRFEIICEKSIKNLFNY